MSVATHVDFLVELFREETEMIMPSTYPLTYQRETAPSWLRHAAALGGAVAPDPAAPFRYLELGCGRGYSALIHAASHPAGEFHAYDRDDAAIAQGKAMAARAGIVNINFHAASFAEIAASAPFDFIVAHGVYSWVAEEARATVRALLRDRLAAGGLAYVSYNCLPGWAAELPLRRMLSELSGNGVAAGARALERLRAAGFAYFTQNPAADRAVAAWAEQPEAYLAHEYLAEAWEPMWSADVHEAMAGLDFVASATLRDNHEALLVDAAAAEAVAALPSARLKLLAMDFATNRGFRRDVFGKDAARGATLRELPVAFAAEIPESILVPRGRVHFGAAFVSELRKLAVRGPARFGDLVIALGGTEAAARNLMWLVAAGALSPAAPDEAAGLKARATLKAAGFAPA